VVQNLSGHVPILGVCLGMQVIAAVAGAKVLPSGSPVHGKAYPVFHDANGLFTGLPSPFLGARYHSLQVDPRTVPPCLEVTAHTSGGILMGCRLRQTRTDGVLFHPESFLTEHGPRLLRNFLGTAPDVV
jgi:anthranilate synthase/aminodeoxychorismate synthase-like glutamine amidotransferase